MTIVQGRFMIWVSPGLPGVVFYSHVLARFRTAVLVAEWAEVPVVLEGLYRLSLKAYPVYTVIGDGEQPDEGLLGPEVFAKPVQFGQRYCAHSDPEQVCAFEESRFWLVWKIALPRDIQKQADKQYARFEANPNH